MRLATTPSALVDASCYTRTANTNFVAVKPGQTGATLAVTSIHMAILRNNAGHHEKSALASYDGGP